MAAVVIWYFNRRQKLAKQKKEEVEMEQGVQVQTAV